MSDKEDTRRTPKYGYGHKQEPWHYFQENPDYIRNYVPRTVDPEQISIYITTWGGNRCVCRDNYEYNYLVVETEEYRIELLKRHNLAKLLNKLLSLCDNSWVNSFSTSKATLKQTSSYRHCLLKKKENIDYDEAYVNSLSSHINFFKQLSQLIINVFFEGKPKKSQHFIDELLQLSYESEEDKELVRSFLDRNCTKELVRDLLIILFKQFDNECMESFICDYLELTRIVTVQEMEYLKNRPFKINSKHSKVVKAERKEKTRSDRRRLQIACKSGNLSHL